MKLYHGTSWRHVDAILRDGIQPRGRKRGNWKDAPAHKECVYMTDAYAPYFAVQCSGKRHDGLVIEIETDKLAANHDGMRLLPDEDCLEQATRGRDGIFGDDYQKRTKYYRQRLLDYRGGDNWNISLQALGTCAILGTIAPRTITRLARIPKENMHLYMLLWDASISIQNYRFCGERYRQQMTRLMNGPSNMPVLPMDDGRIMIPEVEIYHVEHGKIVSSYMHSKPDERKSWDEVITKIEEAQKAAE